jgi:tripartite-type tricarboxylate transporter receptor subunit TctC
MFRWSGGIAAAIVALAATFLPLPAHSQGSIIVPYGPGGLPDVLARLMAQKLSDATGTSYIVDNRPGAGGTLAAARAAKATPDGRTLFLTDIGVYALAPAMQPALSYHPLNDFAPITQAISGPLFLVVNSSLGVSTVQELVALAKKQPGMNYGSIGTGSSHHLAMAQFGRAAGLELTHVPYRGVQQVTPALL